MTATTAQAPTGRAFKAAVMALAEHLPPGWSARTDDDGRWGRVEGILTGPDGMEISIIENDRPDSWIALGQYPRSRPTGRNSPRSITQTYTRSPKTLGADLTRRLLAPYPKRSRGWPPSTPPQTPRTPTVPRSSTRSPSPCPERRSTTTPAATAVPSTGPTGRAATTPTRGQRARHCTSSSGSTAGRSSSTNGLPEELVMQIVDVLRAHQNHAGTPPTS